MNIKIHSIHFDADSKLLDFIDERINRLENFYDRIIGAEVYLKLEAGKHAVQDKVAEIKISMPGKVLFCEERSKQFEEAVDSASENMLRQIKRHKEKERHE